MPNHALWKKITVVAIVLLVVFASAFQRLLAPVQGILDGPRYGSGTNLGARITAAIASGDCPVSPNGYGCIIHISQGIYAVTSTISLNVDGHFITLVGDGPGTYITCAASANPCVQLNYGAIIPGTSNLAGAGVGLKNLYLEGPGQSSSTTGVITGPTYNPTGPVLDGVSINNFATGVDIQGSSFNVTIDQSLITANAVGINFGYLSEQNRITNSNISRNVVGALFTSGTVFLKSDGNSWDDNSDAALKMSGSSSAPHVELVDDYFENGGGGTACYIKSTGVTGATRPSLIMHGGVMTDDSASGSESCPFVDASGFNTMAFFGTSVFTAGRTHSSILKSTGEGNGVFAWIANNAPHILTTECVGCTGRYASFQMGGFTTSFPWSFQNISFSIGGGTAIADSSKLKQYVGQITTTSATSDALAVTGLTSTGHCSAQALDAAAGALTGVYVPAPTSGSIALKHASSAGANFAMFCSFD